MEEWKDIPGYKGIYQASNLGMIRTAPGKITETKRHGERHWQTRTLKTRGKQASGYRASLWKDGKPKDYLVARLVAMTWVDGYQEGMTVNHKNGNRFDNRIENLEWMTLGDNIRHGFATGLYPGIKTTLRNLKTGKEITFRSTSEASRYLGYNSRYLHTKIKRAEGKEPK